MLFHIQKKKKNGEREKKLVVYMYAYYDSAIQRFNHYTTRRRMSAVYRVIELSNKYTIRGAFNKFPDFFRMGI